MISPANKKDKDGARTPTGRERRPRPSRPREVGGPRGPEPTRYGDWERKGRCIDF